MTSRKAMPEDVQAGLEMRKARDAAGYSQEDVAVHLEMTQQNYQKYEAGTRRMRKWVYDRTLAYCNAKKPSGTAVFSSGFSEAQQDSYTRSSTDKEASELIDHIKESMRKLESIIKR